MKPSLASHFLAVVRELSGQCHSLVHAISLLCLKSIESANDLEGHCDMRRKRDNAAGRLNSVSPDQQKSANILGKLHPAGLGMFKRIAMSAFLMPVSAILKQPSRKSQDRSATMFPEETWLFDESGFVSHERSHQLAQRFGFVVRTGCQICFKRCKAMYPKTFIQESSNTSPPARALSLTPSLLPC